MAESATMNPLRKRKKQLITIISELITPYVLIPILHIPCSHIRNPNCLYGGCHQLGKKDYEKDHKVERAIRSEIITQLV